MPPRSRGSEPAAGLHTKVVVILAISLALIFLVLATDLGHGQGSPGADAELAELLDGYEQTVQNLTARLRTAERGLKVLREADVATELHHQQTAAVQDALELVLAEVQRLRDEASEKEEAAELEEEIPTFSQMDLKQSLEMIEFNELGGTFKTWRTDFRCGKKWPQLPDNTTVECDPANGAPCCSSLGWCGGTAEHCGCPSCDNYFRAEHIQLVKDEGECLNAVEDLGKPETGLRGCAEIALTRAGCGRLIMFSPVVHTEWGCKCCHKEETGKQWKDHRQWQLHLYSLT